VKRNVVSAFVGSVAFAAGVLSWGMASAQPGNGVPKAATIPTVPPPVLPVVPAVAPGYTAPRAEPSSASIVGVTQRPFVGITLQDAVTMALLKNPNLAISASNVRIARYQIVTAKGPFDLQFRVEPASSFSVNPPENAFFAGPGTVVAVASPAPLFPPLTSPTGAPEVRDAGNIIQHQYSFQYGVGGQTINGTQYAAGIQQVRTYNNITLNAYNPYYIASLNLSVTQPLLKDLGMNANKRQFDMAVINAKNSQAQSLVDASNTIAQVEDAYWDLVAGWRNVAIQEEALKEAVRQQQSNVRMAKRGAAAPIDAVESQTQVSNFQNGVFSALQTVSELQNELKGLVVTDSQDPIWNANLVPTSPVQEVAMPPDVEAIVASADRDRPEVAQVQAQRERADLDRDFAKNQALPEANLQVQYESNGFAGLPVPLGSFLAFFSCSTETINGVRGPRICPVVPPASRGTMPYAYHNLWAGAYPAFNVNFTVSFPLQNDGANGLKGAAAQEERAADVNAAGLVARFGYEARNALQTYEAAAARLNAATISREAAEEVYASELRRFNNGLSTTFLVLQRQVQLEQARGLELRAQTDLNKSVVEIERVQGTILSQNGVDLKTLGSQALGRASPAPK